jgi:hypothetical protein
MVPSGMVVTMACYGTAAIGNSSTIVFGATVTDICRPVDEVNTIAPVSASASLSARRRCRGSTLDTFC